MSVIGRDPNPKPTPTSTPGNTGMLPGLGDAISKAAANTKLNIKADVLSAVGTINFVSSLTKAQMQQITPWLKKFGASKADISTVGNAKKYLQNNFNTYIENSGGSLTKLVQLFKNDYIPTSDTTSTTPKSNGVTQYIKKKAPELVNEFVDKTLLTKIGSRNVAPEIRQEIIDGINKLIAEGTTTTSKMDKAGKTTVVQTPGYTDERGAALIEKVVKEKAAPQYGQQKQLSFYDFLQTANSQRGGQ